MTVSVCSRNKSTRSEKSRCHTKIRATYMRNVTFAVLISPVDTTQCTERTPVLIVNLSHIDDQSHPSCNPHFVRHGSKTRISSGYDFLHSAPASLVRVKSSRTSTANPVSILLVPYSYKGHLKTYAAMAEMCISNSCG